ncbi:MAG: flagellar basal body rod protein FlgF [Pseudomonadota bacterium]
MDKLIYTSMTGASAAQERQAVLANNLANVSTTGFRAQLSTFRSVPVNGDGASTRVFAAEATSGFDTTPGSTQKTERNLDAMAQGNAWFAVQGTDGTEAYSRNGAFEVNPQGTLVNSFGQTVLSADGAPVDVPQGALITLAPDGTITTKVDGQPASVLARLKLATPAADDPIKRGEDGLFRSTSGNPLPSDPTAKLQTGSLESSNVSAVGTMVAMIEAARQFDSQSKLMTSAETMDKSASQLLSVN